MNEYHDEEARTWRALVQSTGNKVHERWQVPHLGVQESNSDVQFSLCPTTECSTTTKCVKTTGVAIKITKERGGITCPSKKSSTGVLTVHFLYYLFLLLLIFNHFFWN